MSDLFGIRIYESEWMVPDRIVAIGEASEPYPDDWDSKTDLEKIAWAVAHGAALMVKNIDTLRPTNQRQPSERAND